MELDPYIAEGDEARETLAAIRVALVGVKTGESVYFQSEGANWTRRWQPWIDDRFVPVVGPHLAKVREGSSGGAVNEVIEMDKKLVDRLDPLEVKTGQTAGGHLQRSLAGAKHRPELEKLFSRFSALGSERDSLQFATIFAAHCACHHVPLTSSLAAYLYFELCGAVRSESGGSPSSRLALPLILPAVRQVIDERPPSSYQVA